MTHLSLFSGVGGFDLAFDLAGFNTVAQVEFDPHCREVLAHHWPEVPRHEDIREFDGREFHGVTVLSGGFPCSDVSRAGKGAGLAGERSGLWWEMVRIIREADPEWVVWENVCGLLTSERGGAMGTVLRTLADRGYSGSWRVLDSANFGAAQRRPRVYGVFARGSDRADRAREVLLDDPRDGGDLEASSGEGDPAPESAAPGDGPGRTGCVNPCWYDGRTISATLDVSQLVKQQMMPEKNRCAVIVQSDLEEIPRYRFADECEVCPCCEEPWCPDCNMHYAECGCVGPGNLDEWSEEHWAKARRIMPLEAERLQGFPDSWTDVNGMADTHRYRMMGNAVTVNVAYWIALRLRQQLED